MYDYVDDLVPMLMRTYQIRLKAYQARTKTSEGGYVMVRVLNVDGTELTPCLPERAWREVNRARADWVDSQTIRLRYNPFCFPGYRKAVLARDGHTCQWCGGPATTVDHIVPSSKGGSDLPVNLLASCGDCNTRRGNRSARFYLKEKVYDAPNLLELCYRIVVAAVSHRLSKRTMP